MSNLKVFVLCALLLGLAIPIAIACGPDFPFQLLDNRVATLKVLPDSSFAFEAAHLVPVPPDAPKPSGWHLNDTEQAAEYNAFEHNQQAGPFERNAVETQTLSSGQLDAIAAMRLADSDQKAGAAGEALPHDVSLYTLGAIDFARGDYAVASRNFSGSIAAGQDHPGIHSVWASFMLGRSLDLLGDAEWAVKAFSATRRMVAAGAPDPLNVGIATYGEEARLSIQEADRAKLSRTQGWQSVRAHALRNAVRLYAVQEAISPQTGLASLLVVADEILFDKDDLAAAFEDELTRNLVIDYALSVPADEPNRVLSFYLGHRALGAFDKAALAVAPPGFDPMVNLRAMMEQRKAGAIAGSDRLAALAYRAGRYDLAAGFASHADTPLALWVRAKLAVREGNTAEAIRLYASGVAALKTSPETPVDPDIATRMKGEQSVFSLSRQDYVGAMRQIYPEAKTYWGDVAYLGERILTLDELKAFVDASVPADASQNKSKAWWEGRSDLRGLLARRLVREGRADEAIDYFPADQAQLARDYAGLVKAATKTTGSIDRANVLYRLAESERKDGMELMGYETSPDFFDSDGMFDGGPGQISVFGQQQPDAPIPGYEEAYTSTDEERRFAATTARPNLRFHYRYIAADHADAAANLLPPRSQAFAAVLCHEASYVGLRDPNRNAAIYKRYVTQGAFVPWATEFGQTCPEPDFSKAKHFKIKLLAGNYEAMFRRHKRLAGIGVFALLAATAAGMAIERRKSVRT